MCDGGFDGSGCGDADYEDLDFRLQNPHVYGNDEYMHFYYSSGKRSRQDEVVRIYSRMNNDQQFSEEYQRWKQNHPDKVALYRKHSKIQPTSTSSSKDDFWAAIIGGFFFILFLIIACCC